MSQGLTRRPSVLGKPSVRVRSAESSASLRLIAGGPPKSRPHASKPLDSCWLPGFTTSPAAHPCCACDGGTATAQALGATADAWHAGVADAGRATLNAIAAAGYAAKRGEVAHDSWSAGRSRRSAGADVMRAIGRVRAGDAVAEGWTADCETGIYALPIDWAEQRGRPPCMPMPPQLRVAIGEDAAA